MSVIPDSERAVASRLFSLGYLFKDWEAVKVTRRLGAFEHAQWTPASLARDLGLDRSDVKRRLDRLAICGLLGTEKRGGTTRYYLTAPGKDFAALLGDLVAFAERTAKR